MFSLFALVVFFFTLTQSKTVNVELRTAWSRTSLLAEASEFLSAKEPMLFWNFIEEVGTFADYASEKEQFERVLKAASALSLTAEELSLLRMSLSLRYYSATVEMHRQLLRSSFASLKPEAKIASCEAIVQIGRSFVCDAAAAKRLLEKNTETFTGYTLDSDHVYPGSPAGAPTVILYAKIGSKSFAQLFAVMSKARNVRLVLRHWNAPSDSDQAAVLGGFGAELTIKNMEYKAVDDSKMEASADSSHSATDAHDDLADVGGFRFGILKSRRPDLSAQLGEFREYLRSTETRLEDLKVWELQNLGSQAADRIVQSADPLALMQHIAQNFPSVAASLTRIPVNNTLVSSIEANQKKLSYSPSWVTVNGRFIDPLTIEPFSLFEILRTEITKNAAFAELHIAPSEAMRLTSLSLKAASKPRFAMHSDVVQWLSNVEKDAQFQRWPRALSQVVRFKPTWMQQMPAVRRNLFNGVLLVNVLSTDSLAQAAGFSRVVRQAYPLRLGVILYTDVDNDVAVAISKAFLTLLNNPSIGGTGALTLFAQIMEEIGHGEQATDSSLSAAWSALQGYYSLPALAQVVSSAAYNDVIAASTQFVKDFGFDADRLPLAFMNGALVSSEGHVVNGMLQELMAQLPHLKKMIQAGKLRDEQEDLYAEILSLGDGEESSAAAFTRYNPYVEPTRLEPLRFLNLAGNADSVVGKLLESIHWIQHESGEFEVKSLSHIVAVDLADVAGLRTALSAVDRLVERPQSRVGLVHNPSMEHSERAKSVMHVLRSALRFMQPRKSYPLVRALLDICLRAAQGDASASSALSASRAQLVELAAKQADVNAESLVKFWSKEGGTHIGDKGGDGDEPLLTQSSCAENVLLAEPGQIVIVTNGRVVSLERGAFFEVADFAYLDAFEARYSDVLRVLQEEVTFVDVGPDEQTTSFTSDVLMKVVSVLGVDEASGIQKQTLSDKLERHVRLRSGERDQDDAGCVISVSLLLDPLSKATQRFIPMMRSMMQSFDVCVELVLNPSLKVSEPPLKTFYSYVVSPEPIFDEKSGEIRPVASFGQYLPKDRLLTLQLETHEAWLVAPVVAKYDLDNIRLDQMATGDNMLFAAFEVQHVLTEGNCMDLSAGGVPPRGLQLTLGTDAEPRLYDTVVMSNFGYFQLKSTPGVWRIELESGRSNTLYRIRSKSSGSSAKISPAVDTESFEAHLVVVSSFSGAFENLKVSRREGMEDIPLLGEASEEEEADSDDNAMMRQLQAMLTGKPVPPPPAKKAKETKQLSIADNETLHVFSVASGHLYERFLKIMMLTVRNHTENPVKFWILSNFISPRFKDFIPHMAKRYNFDVELVTYKWPSWLNKQTEKQRIIWAYKILFLDVLFPLDVHKIVYIDADQIVRTDIKELWQMDLGGAPYAFTPFCRDRSEMDGFRFWKGGYWENHLQGKPYHISALYFVDLQVFRRQAAGDQLRATYDSLSRDPNSLANLDQDLPNYLQHQVRIYSLPQEWLWCETWCSEESKERAKTIDLCNNPLTKSPKLDNAIRIVENWTDYDLEIKALEQEVAIMSDSTSSVSSGSSSSSSTTRSTSTKQEHTEL